MPQFSHKTKVILIFFYQSFHMQLFIPTNEPDEKLLAKGFRFKPLIIDAYQYHLCFSTEEKTQNLFSKKVKAGTVTIKSGKTCEL